MTDDDHDDDDDEGSLGSIFGSASLSNITGSPVCFFAY